MALYACYTGKKKENKLRRPLAVGGGGERGGWGRRLRSTGYLDPDSIGCAPIQTAMGCGSGSFLGGPANLEDADPDEQHCARSA